MNGIIFGKKYTDRLHGFEGVATARTEFITGCARVCLETIKDDQIKESWFDETRLKEVKLSPDQQKPGGPGPVAPSRTSGSR